MAQQQTTFPRIWTEIINNILPINGVLKSDTPVVKRERAEGKQKKKKVVVVGGWAATSQAPLLKSVCNMKACREEEKGLWEQGCWKHNKHRAAMMIKWQPDGLKKNLTKSTVR